MAGDGTAELAERVHRAEALRAAGKRTDAITTMEAVVSDSTHRFGTDHVKTLDVRNALASLWVEDAPDARRLRRTVELVGDCERVLGPDDPTTLGAREHVASLLALNGHHEEALLAAARAIDDASRLFGPGDARTLSARKNRAATLFVAGESRRASDELEAVLADMERSPGVHAATTILSARRLLALCYRAAGMRAEAGAVLEPLVADCARVLGADAPLTQAVRDLLAEARVYEGPYVAVSGTSPRPWVFVADGRRPGPERFGVPRPLSGVVGSSAPNASALEVESSDVPLPEVDAAVHPSLFEDGRGFNEEGAQAVEEDGTPAARGVVVLVLGPVEITGWTRPATREPQLAEILCYLVLHRDHPVRPAALRLALRPDLQDEITEETLRAYLSHLRRTLGRDLLPHATKDGYRLSHDVTSDWERFGALAGEEADASSLEAALRLVRGRPFAGVAEGSFKWVDAELFVSAMETAVGNAARRLADMTKTADPERSAWAVRQGLLGAPYDWELWRLYLELASARGPVALARARKEAEAVLGDDARSLGH